MTTLVVSNIKRGVQLQYMMMRGFCQCEELPLASIVRYLYLTRQCLSLLELLTSLACLPLSFPNFPFYSKTK